MAQHAENNRATWSDPSHRKRFIDLCLHEINNGFRSGRTLKPSAWTRIAKELETSIGRRFHQKQLKNGWDYMRRQYLEWTGLIKTVGEGYNSTTHNIDWPPERWEEYLKHYPEAKKFCHKPLANVEELEVLFGGVLVAATNNSNSSVHSTSVSSKRLIKLENDCSVPTPHPKSPNFDYLILNEEQSREESEKRRKLDEITFEEVIRFRSVLEKREDRGPCVKECMAILRKLLTFEDPIYFVAVNAFCKRREYRELWVDMESDLERIAWIQSLLKKR